MQSDFDDIAYSSPGGYSNIPEWTSRKMSLCVVKFSVEDGVVRLLDAQV